MYCRNCGNEMHPEAAVCVKCGVPAGKGNQFCPNCGAPVNEEAVVCVSCGTAFKKLVNHNVKPRNLVVAIILSLVTCGIYSIYWFVKLTNEMNTLSGNEKDTSGGIAYLLNLVTCGIYGYYWAYRMGVKRDSLDDKESSNGIIYLVLMFLGLGVVVFALIQDAINKAVEEN